MNVNKDIKLKENKDDLNLENILTIENIEKISHTLPGYIIKLMFLNNRYMKLSEILNETMNNLTNLRKADGSFYSGCIKKIVLSTLNCTKLFISKYPNNENKALINDIKSNKIKKKSCDMIFFYNEEIVVNHYKDLFKNSDKQKNKKINKILKQEEILKSLSQAEVNNNSDININLNGCKNENGSITLLLDKLSNKLKSKIFSILEKMKIKFEGENKEKYMRLNIDYNVIYSYFLEN